MVKKPVKKSGPDSEIIKMREYFKTLNSTQKKEFIQNLKQKLTDIKSKKYADFLSECVKAYNKEVRERDYTAVPKKDGIPEISPESFAQALVTMISGVKPGSGTTAIAPKLIGTWQREADGKIFYYKFMDDGTFETNDAANHETLQGHFSVGVENAILLEPHEILQVNGLTLSVSGDRLTISLTNGKSFDYKRVKE